MKKRIIFFLFFIFLNSFIVNCSFQTEIFSELNKKLEGKNLIISPLSIYQILSLTTNGAKNKTQSEMIETLGEKSISKLNEVNYDILDISKDYTTIEIANAVMAKFDPLSEFKDIAEKYFSTVEPLESVEQVNGWCNEKTHGKIPEILDKLDPAMIMILLNAVYFKGEWSSKFVSEDTTQKEFYNFNDKDEEVIVDTMTQKIDCNYYEDEKVQIVEMPYKKEFMSAVIILPAEDIDINDYIQELNKEDNLSSLINKLKYLKVYLELPKFEVNFFSSVKGALMNMGMKSAFEGSADFTGLREGGGLYINDVIHKTYLKVTEDGTEAAAVTAVMAFGSAGFDIPVKIYEVKVNRPFLFLLRNRKFPVGHDMLFMSKIEEIKN